MNLSDLLKSGQLRRIEPDFAQADECIKAAERDLRVAKSTLSEDADWSYSIAYNAMLQAARALMFSDGFAAAGEDRHKTAVDYAEAKLGAKNPGLLLAFDAMRRKRHRAVYEKAGAVSGFEAKNAVRTAGEFVSIAKAKVSR